MNLQTPGKHIELTLAATRSRVRYHVKKFIFKSAWQGKNWPVV